jgi:Na+/proline symporter
MIPVIGAVMTQELIARVLAAKNVSVARKSSFIAGGMYLSLGAIPAFLGLIGPKVIPGIDSVESYLPMLAQTVLPQYLYILFSGALISAILSTVDSILLAQSALVTHNFLVPVFKITDEKKKVFYGRLCVVIAGVLAYILALHAGRIYDLVIYAESLGSAGVVAITAIALIWKKGHEKAAILALVIGLIAVPINENLLELQAPFVSAIIMSLISYLIGVKLSNLKVF